VSLDGAPLPAGRVVFLCEGGEKPVLTSKIDAEGHYRINSCPVGPAQITVETFEVNTTDVPNSFGSPIPAESPDNLSPSGPFVKIPARYNSAATSGLSVEVVGGEQTNDLKLTPEE